MMGVRCHAGTVPITADCSAAVTLWYKWAGAPDPNGLNYNGTGYTGTLLGHGRHIALKDVLPGDVIVYGPGTGWHTALVVEAGPDPLTVSHGQQGDPNYCRVSQDGRLPPDLPALQYPEADSAEEGTTCASEAPKSPCSGF